MNLFGKKKTTPFFRLVIEGDTEDRAEGDVEIRGNSRDIEAMLAATLNDNPEIMELLMNAMLKLSLYKIAKGAPKAKKPRAKKE